MNMNKSMKYRKGDLLEVLKENREKHKAEYDRALVQYNKELIQDLKNKLQDAKVGKEVSHIGLLKPEEHLVDYDRAIRMFTLTSEEHVELDQRTFCQLVMDDWDWKRSFAANTIAYAAKGIT